MRMQKVIFPLVVAVGFLSALALYGAGAGYQSGMFELGQAFGVLTYAAIAGISGAGLSIFYILWQRPLGLRLAVIFLSALVGLATFYLPYRQQLLAQKLPLIHDVTTDTSNPPAFVAVAPLRAGAPNPAEYDGAEVAALQREGYPDIRSKLFANAPQEVFAAAVKLAESSGWTLVAADQSQGRIEATVSTRWFGFKDDVVIRIQPGTAGASVFDMRSKSRVGLSDIGVNAARIRSFIKTLDSTLTNDADQIKVSEIKGSE
jgi:uncharacterized protein (DUF1499 family)